ncbi:UvrD-helicase domain-containing protein [Zhongshania guokunii]|uniref:DNA 3'-5' helicase n=1 Tax=Zhongshania guokunii TaxID=641783 RepID=A0ABV3U4M8_9GAMM
MFITCPNRTRILEEEGHILVTGGPGCGKTTIAIKKALLRINAGLLPGQKVLFLSFSRAAVARIIQASRQELTGDTRSLLEIQTFHSLFWHFVKGHGYLLGAKSPIRLMAPHDERTHRSGKKEDSPDWSIERERLFIEEGQLTFELFAPMALALISKSLELRNLIAARYPLIIIDEAQDTGTDQWAFIEALANQTQVLCLADLDQQIYDFRNDVSPDRINQIMRSLMPLEIDLGSENNRSPRSEVVQFGNDILTGKPRGSPYKGVKHLKFQPRTQHRTTAIRRAIGIINSEVIKSTGSPPQNIGFLTNWGKGVTIIAQALQGGDGIQEIPHKVIMDEAEVLLATRVVALCIEPITDKWNSLATGLNLIADLYQAKGNTAKALKLRQYSEDATSKKLKGNAKCPKVLSSLLEHFNDKYFSGNPSEDWMKVRKAFESSAVVELQLIAKLVIYLMGFNRGRKITDALSEQWLKNGSYTDARALIEAAIAEDQIIGSDGDLKGISVMTIHKSKGKEFDAIILLHIGNNISPFSSDYEQAPHQKSRRLLRVGITRAKENVLLLTDVFTPPVLLQGHKF